ncbi:glucosaminidase domain-containing protein [Elizabethkingia sp. JS20170427COW]|uniref:glucosaminidase domain-containing protein n=1 Tax=Elizabethkingia sp. JS20170427COW TaxID=2583851 RepID=UPI001110E899|nr:glucosaminidase domain-containing protein [Elizabethkingia sp. JS20170427COW]QCX52658.1 muramidase [Elizabethkingia sp. JS20170427COW]
MKHFKNIKVVVISLVLTFISTNINAQNKYIKENEKLAATLSQEYGIPSSIILAIAYVESGGGTSKNSKVLKNHFGIVGKNNVPNYKSRYKSFDSIKDSYIAFCELLSRKKYYSKLKGSDNHNAWIKAIAAAGYSTQPEAWKQKISSAIKKLGLAD